MSTPAAPGRSGSHLSEDDYYTAFEFAFPVYEMAKLRRRALHDRSDPGCTGLNAYWHQERLATAEDRWVTTPNIDTLYSVAWVDLSQGPVQVTIPPTDGRYLSLALLDIYSNNFACMSQRDVGSAGASFTLVGPQWSGALERDRAVVHAPFDDVMLFARTLVDDDADLPAARRVQHGFQVRSATTPAPGPAPSATTDPGEEFVDLVREALRRNPPRSHEQTHLALLRRTGLAEAGDEEAARRWGSLLPGFLARLKDHARGLNAVVDQWVYSLPNVGDFGTAYALRASVALGGLLALPAREAMYLSTESDAQGGMFHGDHVYRFDLPAGGLPADAFWSLTLYEKMPNGARFLARNPLGRHAFTDRSPSMRGAVGTVPVWISHRRPPAALEPNWLPAPAAPFRLALRAYHPRPDLLAGRFRLKPVQRMDGFDGPPAS